MNRRMQIVGALILTLVLTVGLVPAGAMPGAAAREPQPEPVSLVQVHWSTTEDLKLLEELDVAVYARLSDADGPYLLVGAGAADVAALLDTGLAVEVLDGDMAGASYYLAAPAPGRRTPEWSSYGQVLLDGGGQALLRIPSNTQRDAVEALAQAGASVQAVTLDPKPLYPRAPTQAFPQVILPDPLVQSMMTQVTSATVSDYDRQLAGELPVWVDGDWYTITTRQTYSGTPIQKAGRYVGQRMADLGLDVEYHVWNAATNPNVIGEMTGLVNPDDIYIIGAHLDDVTGTPGADDNASGSVATMLAADILTQYEWGCTLRFAFWTGEEQGLLGSHAYAQRAFNSGENILGYLNLDMIAYNTIGSPNGIDLLYHPSMPPTLQLAQLFADVLDAYNLNLIPDLRTSLSGGSDHSSFWEYGYTSILAIEDQGDFNPYYHGPGDTPAHTDLPYFTEFVKASLGTFAHMTGCLVPGGIGALDGHVTAAGSGTPIPDVTITMLGQGGAHLGTTTDSSGYYTQTLLADTYTVTAEAYAYLPAVITGVVVLTDSVTTLDIALEAAPSYVVSGTVTEAGSGVPLAAGITFDGSPVTAASDPMTGYYEATLPAGAYTMHVQADNHRPQARPIVVDGNQTQSFALEPLPCVLLVDDDNNAPDVLPYYQTALDNLGYDYDVFTASGSGPSTAEMDGYGVVIWFSGDAYNSSNPVAGPNPDDEVALAAYLDGGGSLFLSAQDYLYDMGLTTFGGTYLGIGSYTNDSGNAGTKYGVAGDPIGGGLGPYPLSYPAGFSDYGDIVNAGAGASVAFRSGPTGGNNLDVDKDGGDWKTVFFGTSWVPIQNNSAANGQAVLERILDWFGGCECEAPQNVAFEWMPPEPRALETVTFTGTAQSDLAVGYTWDMGDGVHGTGPVITHAYSAPADYAVVMTATNLCGTAAISHTVVVSGWCEPVSGADFVWTPPLPAAGETVVLTATATGDLPIDYAWDLGDGSVAHGMTVSHVYAEAGGYPIVLTASNACGSAVVSHTLAVEPACEPAVALDLTWAPAEPVAGEMVTFTATATGTPPLTYTWDLGDGQVTTGVIVTHAYTEAGEYTVLMSVDNACGSDVMSGTLEVAAPSCEPVSGAALDWAPLEPVVGETVVFTGTATGDQPITYTWALGDGLVATGITATHAYTQPGEYPIVMTATNACGEDVVTDTLAVADLPCAPVEIVTVTVGSASCSAVFAAELAGHPPFAYTWDLGAWGIYHTPAVTATVSTGGTYPYTLTVANCGGLMTAVYTGTFTAECQAPRWYTYLPLAIRGPQ